MNNKKRNAIITIVMIVTIFLVGAIIFFLNYTSDDSSLSIIEKKWITDHANQIVDVDVYNDVPVYGYNGSGITFDFLEFFTQNYQINFNKIPYYTKTKIEENEVSFLILEYGQELGKNDLLLYEDYYVILNKEIKEHISLEEIDKIGYLSADKKIFENYFSNEIELIEYEDVDKMFDALDKKEISYLILPNMQYMNVILKNELSIVYHLSDINNNYVLRSRDDTTYSILKKSYIEYLKTDYKDDYSKNYLNSYFESTNTTDLLRKNYNAKTYKYGYTVNMPYENDVNGQFVGTISNYLNEFESITDVEIEFIRYNSIDEIKSALVSGEIDFALGNFHYENLNMDSKITNTMENLEYVVLSKEELWMNSIKGLQNKKVSVVGSSILYQLCKENEVSTNTYINTDELLRSIDDKSILLIDKQTFIYYKDNKLKDYKMVYEGTIENGYKFIMNDQNEPFNDIFNYYISTIDYHKVRYQYHTDITLDKDYTTIKILGFIVALILFLVSTIIFINRKNVTNTVISKEEKLKYIDPMTSLKNRNYLNMNIYNWDDNVIFPQSVVVFDINHIKEVNDKYGREAGDEIIKKVASILINNQLENTDIIRSGGDEFLIYMVGYEEKKVAEYSKDLLKLMKNIPNSTGVEVGYSMILDEVKTVDDAINEAITMMTKNKEKRK